MSNNTIGLLKKYGIRLDKYKSQNYLIDDNKINFILRSADIKDDEIILEVGAGIGTLTIPMAKLAKEVVAIEKDPVIADILRQEIIKNKLSNVTIINSDALKVDFPYFDKVVSNLPYKISSPVTFKLLEYPFKEAILMYQLEFARRMQAECGTSDYSRLSVALHFRADVSIIDTLPPEAFIPRPKINSAIIRLTPKDHVDMGVYFDRTLRALFQHRNKKAKKALIQSAHELGMDKKELKSMLSGVDCELLEEKVFKLTPEEILRISQLIEEIL